MKYSLLLCLLASLLLVACDTDKVELGAPFGSDYYPLEAGRYVSYNVTQTTWVLNGPQTGTTVTYQLKDTITGQFNDLANGLSYRIERYRRENRLDNWRLVRVWTARTNRQSVIRTEENMPYVKLVFPIEEGRSWNGNVFNGMAAKNYYFKDLNKTHTFAGRVYDKTATVIQSADSSLVGRDIRREIYAKDVGIIYKRSEEIVYLQDELFGKNVIERGELLEMTAFEYGKKQ